MCPLQQENDVWFSNTHARNPKIHHRLQQIFTNSKKLTLCWEFRSALLEGYHRSTECKHQAFHIIIKDEL
jgi:hypothetical protein